MNDVLGIDSNIFIYAADKSSPFYSKALNLVADGALGKIEAVLVPQNLTEYYATVTNSKKTPKPISVRVALDQVEKLLQSNLKLVYPNRRTIQIFINLLGEVEVKGQKVHDIFLAATLLSNGVKTLITENKEDFAGIKGLKVVDLEGYSFKD